MRFYNLILNINGSEIKENSLINLKAYDYDNPISAVNSYCLEHRDNDINFIIYREKDDCLYACVSFDENSWTLDTARQSILNMLNNVCSIDIDIEFSETTLPDYADCCLESKRRLYFRRYYDVVPEYYSRFSDTDDRFLSSNLYDYDEYTIDEISNQIFDIYDPSLSNEINNIQSHKMIEDSISNIVHYYVASKSPESAKDIISNLTNALYKANRINSKRVISVKNFKPEVYKQNNYLNALIEDNLGGTIVIDLTNRFEFEPDKYVQTAKYLENLFKQYHNECLFIFTYNIDQPGFSYFLLPELKKYAISVKIKEGIGNKKEAIQYLQALIQKTKYSQYADQAEEFLNQFKKDSYSQSDIYNAFDQFEPWCLNKNHLQAYDYNFEDDFMLERDDEDSAHDTLQSLIGLETVKQKIDQIIKTQVIEKEKQKCSSYHCQAPTNHMIFAGNPGTAKTTVAKLFAKIAKEKGLSSSGIFVERSGVMLNTVELIHPSFVAAKGGVLFIDEAYGMRYSSAITALVQEIENNREDVIVILAGYNADMKQFLSLNEGLKSRIPYWVDFPDYSDSELVDIFKLMLEQRHLKITDEALKEVSYILYKAPYEDDFGNGRYVRNLIDRIIQNQSTRLYSLNEADRDLFLIEKDDITAINEYERKERKNGSAQEELNEMIGLDSVKEVIDKALASYKYSKYCLDKGIDKEKPSLHMVFTGNPGTAKTTVARLFAEILKDEKVLPTNKFLELGRADLVGQFVGQTAPLVQKRFRQAKGGVLFIDEAYSLSDGQSNSFGDEAINTIVQEMENHRDDVVVIFAGYPKQMQEFLDRNPGMKSRIAFHVHFDDYNPEQLCEITKVIAHKKRIELSDSALKKLEENYQKVYKDNDFGNGRYVRKMLEEAEMNLAKRLFDHNELEVTEDQICKIDACDIPEEKNKTIAKRTIGLVNSALA